METDISDHHALISSLLKTTFTKMPPNNLKNRNYKQFEVSFYKMLDNYPKKSVIQNGKKVL